MSTRYFSPFFSATAFTAFTIISANCSESFLTSLVCMDVFAIFNKIPLSVGSTLSAI